MKSKRLAKLIALAVTALLLIGVAVGFSVSAAETTAEIGYINVAYEGQLRLVYDVKNVTLDEGEKLAVLIWEDGEDQTIENAQVVVYCEPCRSDAYSRFYSDGFAPKDLRKPVSAAAAILDADGALVKMGKTVATYSVYDYVMGRFAYGKNTPDQQALYIALLDYGAAVQEVLYDSYIAQGATEEVATVQAGLTYGYSDEYYEVAFVKSTMMNGAATTDYDVVTYRPDQIVDFEVDQFYLGRVFTGFTNTSGEPITGDNITSASYRRYTVNSSSLDHHTTIVANYQRVAGLSADEAPALTTKKMSQLYGKSGDVAPGDTTTGFSVVDDADGSGITFEKTPGKDGKIDDGGYTVQFKPDVAKGNGVVVLDMDISINDMAWVGNWSNIVLSTKNEEYKVRLNFIMDTTTGKVYLETAAEMCYVPEFTVSSYDENGKATAFTAAVTTTYGNKCQTLSGVRIPYGDVRNVRIEYYPDDLREVDYEYKVTYKKTVDGEEKTITENRTTTVMSPVVKYYINGILIGETYHGGYQDKGVAYTGDTKNSVIDVNNPANDKIINGFNKAKNNKTELELSYASFTFFYAGAANITVDNVYYNVGNPYLTSGDVSNESASFNSANKGSNGEVITDTKKSYTGIQNNTVYRYLHTDGKTYRYAEGNGALDKVKALTNTYDILYLTIDYHQEVNFEDNDASIIKWIKFNQVKITPVVDGVTGKATTEESITIGNNTYKKGDVFPRQVFGRNYAKDSGNIDILNAASYILKLKPNLHMDDNDTTDKWDQVSILEFDMSYTDLVGQGNLEIGFNLNSKTNGDAYAIRWILSITPDNKVKFAEYSTGKANMENGIAGPSAKSVEFNPGQKFNVRIELYQNSENEADGYVVKTYFNNVLKMETSLVWKTKDHTTVKNSAPKSFRINYPNYGRDGLAIFENIYFYSTTVKAN